MLILTTIPHFYSILPLVKYYRTFAHNYINIIVLSSTFSILYHASKESNAAIATADYFLALLWFSYDIYLGYTHTTPFTQSKIILGNLIIFFINTQISNKNYTINHSIWHILSACKSFYVSKLLERAFLYNSVSIPLRF